MLVVRFRQTFRERASEWMLALMLAGWGFIVIQSPGLFDRPFYAALSSILSQSIWGWGAFFVGMGRLVVLFINGAWRRTPTFRQIGACCGMAVWIGLAMGALAIEWRSPALGTYLGLFVLDALNLSFAARDGALVRQGAGHGHG